MAYGQGSREYGYVKVIGKEGDLTIAKVLNNPISGQEFKRGDTVLVSEKIKSNGWPTIVGIKGASQGGHNQVSIQATGLFQQPSFIQPRLFG